MTILDLERKGKKSKSKKSKNNSSIIVPRSIDMKAERFVHTLFGVQSVSDLPDDYDPLDLIAQDHHDSFDLMSLVSKSIDPVTGIPLDVRLPEGDFKEAKNFFDFCLNFRGKDAKFPFPRQMWACTHLLAEWCPRCSHPRWHDFDRVPVNSSRDAIRERVVFLEYGVCPECGVTKGELLSSHELNNYSEAAWMWGQRAGKSTVVSSASEYITHKYLKFPKMSSICEGISNSTPLSATFVGLRFADAFSLLWEPISKGIADNPWFKDYHEMLDDYGKRLGVEFYRSKDQYLKYMHKNIELYPAGPSKRALRGRTRILTGTDELGWFPVGVTEGENEDRERADADEVHHALDRSLLTVRTEIAKLVKKGYNNFINALAFNISSPSDENDKISRLVKENKGSRKVLAIQAATWDISPFYTRENEEIAEAYRKNPEQAARDYGAIPPSNARQFIYPPTIIKSFAGQNRVVVEAEEREIDNRMRRAGRVTSSNPDQPQPPSVMAIDAGYSNNAFAVTIQNLKTKIIGIGEMAQQFKVIQTPVLLEVQPTTGTTLHFTRIYKKILKPLIVAFNVRALFADRWNSIALLDQAAEDFLAQELMARQYSVKYKDFLLTRSYLQEEKLILPKLEVPAEDLVTVTNYPECFAGRPAAHLFFQMGKVRDVGSTVTKGAVYTDDLFRALTLNTSRILDLKVQEHLEKFASLATRGPAVGAISAGFSMGMNRAIIPLGGRNSMSAIVSGHSQGIVDHNGRPIGQHPGQPQHSSSVIVGSRFLTGRR
jgi:hypothetical protein